MGPQESESDQEIAQYETIVYIYMLPPIIIIGELDFANALGNIHAAYVKRWFSLCSENSPT